MAKKKHPISKVNQSGKIVAIDLETGDFEVDKSEIAACDRLEAYHPDAQIWIVRIGSRHVRRFGVRIKRIIYMITGTVNADFEVIITLSDCQFSQ